MRRAWLAAPLAVGLMACAPPADPPAAEAQAGTMLSAGEYFCTVAQKAGISSTHLEGAGAPRARAGAESYRFKLSVVAEGAGFRVTEAAYDGADRSDAVWEDDNSTLHAPYVGDGRHFEAEGGPGFLDFAVNRWGEGLQFYHAGYEYAGGEDEHLSVRWGWCVPA